MSVDIGSRLGSLEITALLGKGGMGEVYRARDLKLKREVAIKLLPDEFARVPERVSRFQREAEVLASLNHPNIANIYDLEEQDGAKYLVLELVEGETLADRIARAPIPLEESLTIAKQICDALEAAHESGIVHRDLKPANIKLTREGKVKVLDFGLAKALDEGGLSSLSQSPTRVSVSAPGLILGTAAYMSPEQANGKDADRRSDIWSLGCILFEMLSGKTTFQGETANEILAAVMKTEPDWRLLPARTPPQLLRLLRRCLERDRQHRLQHVGDARLEIIEAQNAPVTGTDLAVATAAPTHLRLWKSAVLFLALVAAGLIWIMRMPQSATSPPEVRFEFTTPPTPDSLSLAISPDGQQLVFVATTNGRPMLWLRPMNSVSSRPLSGTDDAFYPFWAPDNRSIGFFADGKLKRFDIDGGLVRVISNAPNPLGGSWNADGTIVFTPNYSGPIFRVNINGGEPEALTQIQAPEASHRFPTFLPDGRHFLYFVPGPEQVRGIYVRTLENQPAHRLVDAESAAIYTSKHLLYIRDGRLIGQKFDLATLSMTGNPFPIAEHVLASGDSRNAALSASANGDIVYRSGESAAQRQFVWFDRSGNEVGRVGDPDGTGPANPELAPDGRTLGLNRTINGNTDVWMIDLARGLLSRTTFEMAEDANPVWSPDGTRIVFNSDRSGVYDMYVKAVAGNSGEDLLLATPQNKAPLDWSRDGRFLLYRSPNIVTGFDIWALPMQGERKPFPVVQTNSDERDGVFSPDSNWVAYQSNETGRFEIYVQSFPGPGNKKQISTNGGSQVRWKGDGTELFYISQDGRLMAVPVRLSGTSMESGTPVPLFSTQVGGGVQGTNRQQYCVSRDGQRFLMNTVVAGTNASPLTVILNWKPKS
jgi:serine/threonine protein kinase